MLICWPPATKRSNPISLVLFTPMEKNQNGNKATLLRLQKQNKQKPRKQTKSLPYLISLGVCRSLKGQPETPLKCLTQVTGEQDLLLQNLCWSLRRFSCLIKFQRWLREGIIFKYLKQKQL